MSVSAGRTRLVTLTRELSSKWQETKETWRDAKSAEFEKKFMNELVATVNRAVADLEALDKIITQIRSDCE